MTQATAPPTAPTAGPASPGLGSDFDAFTHIVREHTDENARCFVRQMGAMKIDVASDVSRQLQDIRSELPSSSSTRPVSPPQVARQVPAAEVHAEIPLGAPTYEIGTGGVRAFEKCEIWEKLGAHSITAYHARQGKKVGKVPGCGKFLILAGEHFTRSARPAGPARAARAARASVFRVVELSDF